MTDKPKKSEKELETNKPPEPKPKPNPNVMPPKSDRITESEKLDPHKRLIGIDKIKKVD